MKWWQQGVVYQVYPRGGWTPLPGGAEPGPSASDLRFRKDQRPGVALDRDGERVAGALKLRGDEGLIVELD